MAVAVKALLCCKWVCCFDDNKVQIAALQGQGQGSARGSGQAAGGYGEGGYGAASGAGGGSSGGKPRLSAAHCCPDVSCCVYVCCLLGEGRTRPSRAARRASAATHVQPNARAERHAVAGLQGWNIFWVASLEIYRSTCMSPRAELPGRRSAVKLAHTLVAPRASTLSTLVRDWII